MKKTIIALLALNLLFLTACDVQRLKTPQVNVTVLVTEEDGTPISAAKASCSGGLGTPGKRQADGFTTPDGRFTATIASSEGIVKASAEKRGYYHNGTDYASVGNATADQFQPYREGKWQKEEKIIPIILRSIKNPVPMYAKHLESKFPNPGEWTGYDFEAGDWVAPFGKGKVSDFEIRGEGTWETGVDYDGKVTLRFPGRGNGIQMLDLDKGFQYCQFKSPYEAPEEGYNTEWTWWNYSRNESGKEREIRDESYPNRIFILRVRAETDDWGRVTKAQYGKIYGPVETSVGNTGKGRVSFTYYLNPDHTRNLEYDPKQNLFPQIPGKGQEYRP